VSCWRTRRPPAAPTDRRSRALIGAKLLKNHFTPSVNLSIDGDAPFFRPFPTAGSTFFFESAGNAVTLQQYPSNAFDSLFKGLNLDGPSEADLAMQRLRARNKSVLDAVRDSFGELKRGLGADDTRRLEEHAAYIRKLEVDIQISATCSLPTAIPGSGNFMGLRMDQLAPLAAAHHGARDGLRPGAGGAHRVPQPGGPAFWRRRSRRFARRRDQRLQLARDGARRSVSEHHHLPAPGRGSTKTYDQQLLEGYRFFVQQFADLLTQLDALAEGPDTSVLDNSLVILASDLGEGMGHGPQKMGYILAGNLGGAKVGYHFDAGPNQAYDPGVNYYYADSKYSVNQLLNSILDMAGVVDEKGKPVTLGLQGWIEQQGVLAPYRRAVLTPWRV